MNIFIKTTLSVIIFAVTVSIAKADTLLVDNHGQSTLFSSLKGKWVFINYWAAWCQTCVDEIPELNLFYQSHKKDPIALFGVNYDALPLNQQNNLVARFHMTYPNLTQDPSRDLKLGEITGLPVTFIFNPKGELVNTLYGGQNVSTLNKVMVLNSAKTKAAAAP